MFARASVNLFRPATVTWSLEDSDNPRPFPRPTVSAHKTGVYISQGATKSPDWPGHFLEQDLPCLHRALFLVGVFLHSLLFPYELQRFRNPFSFPVIITYQQPGTVFLHVSA